MNRMNGNNETYERQYLALTVEQKIDPPPYTNDHAVVKQEITLAKISCGVSKDHELIPIKSFCNGNKSQLSGAALNEYWRARNTGQSGLAQDNGLLRILEDEDDHSGDDDKGDDTESDAFDAQHFALLKNDITIINECEDNDPNIKVVYPTRGDSAWPGKYLGKKKQFPCDHCEKSFTRRKNMLRHIKTNHELIYFDKYFCPKPKESKMGRISCNHCEKSFTLRSNLKRHIRNNHKDIRPISCPLLASSTLPRWRSYVRKGSIA